MPVFTVPEMVITKYNDGSLIRAGDTVVPCILVVDSNGKMTSVQGASITIADTSSPVVSAQYAVAQTLGNYEFKPSAGTVSDDSSGLLKVYLILTLQSATTTVLQNVVSTFPSGYSVVDITNYVRDTPVQLNTLALASSKVYDSTASAFRDVKEGDSVYVHVMARDPSGLFRSQSVFVNPVADRTPPTGLGFVTMGTITFNSIMVTNLNSIIDGGNGVTSITLHYGTSSTIGAETSTVSFAPSPAYNITGMLDATLYYVWVSATDGTNLAGPTLIGSARTLDSTDPVIANFDVTQTAPYTFSASVGTVTDNAAGPLKAYLVMATTPMSTSSMSSIYASVEASAQNTNIEYTAGASVGISSLGLSTTKYWTGSVFASISESAPATPHQLYAHLFVLDASNNDNSAANAGVAKVVADSTAPQFAGTVTLAADGSNTITVAWSAAVTDGRGLASAAVYYSTTAPTSTSVADVTTWKAAAGTSSYDITNLATLASAGSVSVTGLTAGMTYYTYLCAVDTTGNAGNFVTTPVSVATVAAAPQNAQGQLLAENQTQASSTNLTYLTFTMPKKVRIVGEWIASGGFNYETAVMVGSHMYGVQPATNVGNILRFKAGGSPDDTSVWQDVPFPFALTTRHKFEYILDTETATATFNFYSLAGALLYNKSMVMFGSILSAVGTTLTARFGVYLPSATIYYMQAFEYGNAPNPVDANTSYYRVLDSTPIEATGGVFQTISGHKGLYIANGGSGSYTYSVNPISFSGKTSATVEMWIHWDGTGDTWLSTSPRTLGCFVTAGGDHQTLMLRPLNSRAPLMEEETTTRTEYYASLTNGWTHIAYVADGATSTGKVFVNGRLGLTSSWYQSNRNTTISSLQFGRNAQFAQFCNNIYFRKFRISDVARYKSTFDPSILYPVGDVAQADSTQYYGDYTGSAVSTGPALSPALTAVPDSFTFAKDSEQLYLSTSRGTFGSGMGPAALLRYNHSTGAFDNLGSTSKTNASVRLRYRGHGVTLVGGVPYVAERYNDTRDATTPTAHIVHRYSGGLFQQVGTVFGSEGFGSTTEPGNLIVKHDTASGRLYVGYIAGTAPKILYMDSPSTATSTTAWTSLTLSGAATTVTDFYFAFAPSGLMWLLMINSNQFAAYTVSIAGSVGTSTVKRAMGGLAGPTYTVYSNWSGFISPYDDNNVAMSVGLTGNSVVLVVNGSFVYPTALPLDGEGFGLYHGADTVVHDTVGTVFAITPGNGKVYKYVTSTNGWSQVGPTFTTLQNFGVLVVSGKNADIVMAGTDATGFTHRVIRPTSRFPFNRVGIDTTGAVFSASSTLGGNQSPGSAFDGLIESHYHSDIGTSQWLQVQFPTPKTAWSYRIYNRNNTSFPDAPIDYKLLGSGDGTTFTEIDSRSNAMPPILSNGLTGNISTNTIPHMELRITSPGSYKYYRFQSSKTGGGSRNDFALCVGELALIEYPPPLDVPNGEPEAAPAGSTYSSSSSADSNWLVQYAFQRTMWTQIVSTGWHTSTPTTVENWAQVVYPAQRTVSRVFVYLPMQWQTNLQDAPTYMRVENGSGNVLMANRVLRRSDWKKVRLSDFQVDNTVTTNFVWATGLSFPSHTGTTFRLVVHKVANSTDYVPLMSDNIRINHILFPRDSAPPSPGISSSFDSLAAPAALGTPTNGVYTIQNNTSNENPLSNSGYTPDFTYIFVIKSGNTNLASYTSGALSQVGFERRGSSGQVGQRVLYTDNHFLSGAQSSSYTLSSSTPVTSSYLGNSTRYRAIILRQDFSGASKVRIDVVNSSGLVASRESLTGTTTEGNVHNFIVYSGNSIFFMHGYVRRIGQYISDEDAVAYGRALAHAADQA